MKGDPIEVWGDASKGMDLIYVKDFCQLVEKCLFASSENSGVYNVGTGKMTSLDALVDAIIDVFCSEQKVSEKIYKPEKHDCVNYFMNVDKARHNLGYSPSLPMLISCLKITRKRWRPIVLVISFRSDMAHRPHTARREVGMFSREQLEQLQSPCFIFDEKELRSNFTDFTAALREKWSRKCLRAILLKRILSLGFGNRSRLWMLCGSSIG